MEFLSRRDGAKVQSTKAARVCRTECSQWESFTEAELQRPTKSPPGVLSRALVSIRIGRNYPRPGKELSKRIDLPEPLSDETKHEALW